MKAWTPVPGGPPRNDIAVVHLRPSPQLVATRSIRADEPRSGERVELVGVGSPGDGSFGILRAGQAPIASVEKYWFTTHAVTYASRGDSGGPALDAAGVVVGICTMGDLQGMSVYVSAPSCLGWIEQTLASRGW